MQQKNEAKDAGCRHPIRLIIGLGNPGQQYEHTRHNAGAWFVENIVNELHLNLRMETKYHGLHSIASLHNHVCHLLIPTTFMNLSGQAVRACMHYHKIPTNSILVVHDEIDLPVGTIKLKFDGGDGGHNGLKDIISHLNTKQFYRLRIGVGRPTHSDDVVNYVLKPPSKNDRLEIDNAIQRAAGVLPFVMNGEIQKAMHQLHTEIK